MANTPTPSARRSRWRDRSGGAAARVAATTACLVALAACGNGMNPGVTDARSDSATDTPSTDGGMVTSCPPGQSLCSGACVDVQSSTEHCGACGSACTTGSNATARCLAGVCRTTCAAGFSDCDGNAANGCEVNLATAPSACGSCGNACPMAPHSAPACTEGACALACSDGFSDCDGAYESGCESDTASDRENCGACGRACAWPPRSDFSCGMSACAFTCRRGYADCDRMQANGCEVALVNARNCGACGTTCSGATPLCADTGARTECVATCPPGTMACDGACVDTRSNLDNCGACGTVCRGGVNAQAACIDSRCGLECRPGYADCDNDPANGCEVNLAINGVHCGACGNRCNSGPGGEGYCSAGMCRVRCTPGTLDCDGTGVTGCEVNPNSDQRNCGGCGRACTAPANAAALCSIGSCEFACDPGFGNCDGNATNGCETVLRSDAANCGACGTRCPGGQSCIEGACVDTGCMPGRGECDGNAATMCETDLFTSEDHCGACNARCVREHALAECRAGGCTFEACLPGYGNCDGMRANGCETPVDTVMNCGACGIVCPATNGTPACVEGRCTVQTCTGRFADCNNDPRDGCETDTATNARSCGMCSNTCLPGQSCVDGTCQGVIAPPVDAGIDGGPAPDAMPPMDATVTPDVVTSTDVIATGDGGPSPDAPDEPPACPTGQMRCGGPGGACTAVDTDAANCGMCGRACPAGQVCAMGACGCPAGQTLCGGACVDTAVSATNCGMCANACAAGQSCTAGACTCPMGGTLCNGACTVTATDTDHCGACGNACGPRQTCVAGACTCPMGETRCGTGMSAACVNTRTDTDNCGACGTACPAGQVCSMGACTLTCAAPLVACGSGASMTCADTSSDGANCGACNTRCGAVANTTLTLCSGGRCSALCEPNFGNCDGMYANGCETDTRTDLSNCGACGAPCPTSAPNSTGITCAAATCQPVCATDTPTSRRRDCNNMLADGCEANLLTDLPNCGSCGNVCPGTLPSASAVSCTNGSCTPTCVTNRGNCDGNNANGCETDTLTSTAHCGGCGMACPSSLPDASSVACTAGACAPVCNTGRGNCDGNNTNGCETNTQTSNTHCGACGNACGTNESCVSGACVTNTGVSCRAIKMANPTAADGLYDLDPDGAAGPLPIVRTYCDMTTRGGGWTLVQRSVIDWSMSDMLRTTLAVFRDNTIGNPGAGTFFRMAARNWPLMQSTNEHMMAHTPARADGTSCRTLRFIEPNGVWVVPATGNITLTGAAANTAMFNGRGLAGITTTDVQNGTGGASSCVNNHQAAPWFYTHCCTTCPTFGGSYWGGFPANPPRPMASNINSGSLEGISVTTACAGNPSPVQTSGGYYGETSMEYFIR